LTVWVAILATYAVFFLADCDKSGVRCVYYTGGQVFWVDA